MLTVVCIEIIYCTGKCKNLYLVDDLGSIGCVVCLQVQCRFCLSVVVEWDVVHAEIWLQALEGAVRCVYGATAAVAT